MEKFVIPLSNVNQKDTDLVGFKAANLGALLEAGFSVLNGICITTSAFQFAFYPCREKISELLQKVDQQNPVDAVVVSSQIMSVLEQLKIPEIIVLNLFICLPLPLILIGIFCTYQGVVNAMRALSETPIRYKLSIQFVK